ncbi:hypothetical protein E6O75_ATG04235 [Venturia nashicola]|uniref:Uncharacterized protein n=1 Tax=Venturia nashicola TaxID=86259 RepID=A0A4Z1PMT2_9PEZI|nr:hypothetical protein E6O75_ATG04235 [Venturia nashicola]
MYCFLVLGRCILRRNGKLLSISYRLSLVDQLFSSLVLVPFLRIERVRELRRRKLCAANVQETVERPGLYEAHDRCQGFDDMLMLMFEGKYIAAYRGLQILCQLTCQMSRRRFPDPLAEPDPLDYPDPFDIKMTQADKHDREDDLMALRTRDGKFDIMTRAQHAKIVSALQQSPRLSKRWAFPSAVCGEATDYYTNGICKYSAEEAECLDSLQYQVHCAGCFNMDQGRSKKKTFKNTCHQNTECMDVRFVNDWKEERKFVSCFPSGQTLTFSVRSFWGQPHDYVECSDEIRHWGRQRANVELHLGVYDKENKRHTTPKAAFFKYNGSKIDYAPHSLEMSTSIIMAPRSSAQGCIEPETRLHQFLTGRFAVEYIKT